MPPAIAGSSVGPHSKKGQPCSVQVTGFAATHAITQTVLTPDGVLHTIKGTTDASGNYDFSNAGVITMERPGVYTVTINDGTTTIVTTTRVWIS